MGPYFTTWTSCWIKEDLKLAIEIINNGYTVSSSNKSSELQENIL